jgi:DNA polymerase-3 subunit gamma/tau
MENFIVSARKYRPASFDMVVGQDSITNTLKSAIKNNHLAHAYLFCGPRGVGKTTCARIFAKTINCTNPGNNFEACDECESCISFRTLRSFNIHELDAASNNKVEDIRSLNDQVRIPPQIGKYSIYIIDEVHMLSSAAFNAFLKTLEEPPAHAIFILATTEKQKIIPTILSRCQIFDFNRIKIEDIVHRLQFVSNKESVSAEEEALHVIAQKADGALRDALSIFDQIVSLSGKKITYRDVIENLNVLDYEYYFKTIDSAIPGDVSSILLIFNEILEKGFDGHNFIAGLNNHLRDLMVCKDESTMRLIETTQTIKQRYLQQTEKCTIDFLYKALDIVSACDLAYKGSKNQRLHVELALIRLCRLSEDPMGVEPEKKKPESKLTNAVEEELPLPSKSETLRQAAVAEQIPDSRPGMEPVKHNPVIEKPPKTFSIKDLMADEIPRTAKPIDIIDVNPLADPGIAKIEFSEENIMSAWNQFKDTLKGEGNRIISMFNAIQPEVENGSTIKIHVSNAALKDLFVQDYKQRLVNFLEPRLNIAAFDIETIVDLSESNEIMYTDDKKKFNYLVSKYPSLSTIQKAFNLDYY